MNVLVVVLVAVALIIVLVVYIIRGWNKPVEYDPTRAKIPDHMKQSVAWKAHEREEEERKRRAKGQDMN